MKAADTLVLLFYDGFERRAEEDVLRRSVDFVRRPARAAWRSLKRRQVWTGRFMTYRSLKAALESIGCDVRVNDFDLARRFPAHPIALCGYASGLEKIANLPNPRLLGPGLIDSPLQQPHLFDDPRNRLFVQRAEWERRIFKPYYGDHIRPWYRGYDLNDYEDVREHPKTTDVLIYDKIYHDREGHLARTIEPFIAMLNAQNLSHEIIRYGAYHAGDYLAALRRSRSLAFFAHSEVQGNAQIQASAMNVPVFAWDEGIWLDYLARQLSDQPIWCETVTHFDDRCGVRFKMNDMAARWSEFWGKRDRFEPRAYVAEALSLKGSGALYLACYREAGQPLNAAAA